MFDNLTFQQFCALDYNRNMVVTAGPGAGKTRILSHRFCFILLNDDSVSLPQILTLTFTEKAAEEMQARIYEMLNRLERDLKDNPDNTLWERIREAKEQFHKNRISTIHSFCAGLLREHPVESGVDPGFTVVQGARQKTIIEKAIEEGVSSIWQDSKDNLLPLLKAFGGRRNVLTAIRNLIAHPLTFKRVCDTKERLVNTDGWEKQVLGEYCRDIADNYLVPYLVGLRAKEKSSDDYEELLSILEEWEINSDHDQECFGVPSLFRHMRNLAAERKSYSSGLSVTEGLRKISYVELVKEFYPDIFFNQQPDLAFGKQLDLFIHAAGVCLQRYRREKANINALDFADLEALSYTFLSDLCSDGNAHMLARTHQRFKYVMVDEFQDTNWIQWYIISMLCSQDKDDSAYILKPGKLFVVGDKRQAIYGFRGGDVTVFESVTQKIRDSNPENPVPMFWENREINERMDTVYKGYSGYLEGHLNAFALEDGENKKNILKGDIYLPHNFRTDPQPIAFFNSVFNDIFGNKGAEKLWEYETAPREIIGSEHQGYSTEKQGSVSFYLTPNLTSRKDQSEAEASLIVDIIERVQGKQGADNYEYLNYPDIREKIENNQLAVGILFSTFTYLKTFESIFREAGLSFKVHRGKGFYQCQEVMEMVQLLNYLSDERQTISLLSVLRSPIFGVTDPEIFDLFYGNNVTPELLQVSQNSYLQKIGKQIQSWRSLSCRLTLNELIRVIIADRFLTAVYTAHPNGIQRLANIEKLIELARRFQAEGNGSLSEFAKYCLEMADEEEKEGEALIVSGGGSRPIWLMTIHAAKGLEFPMVIIPDLDRRFPARLIPGKPVRLYSSTTSEAGNWNSVEGELPVWQVEVPELNYTKRYTPMGYLLKRREHLENMAETRRVFYVGCTRAENHLILLGSMKKSLMEKKRKPFSSEDYRDRGTILELLDDIYDFNRNFPYEKSKQYESDGNIPSVFWKDSEPRSFRGIPYKEQKVNNNSFGAYNEKMRNLDLTRAIGSSYYFQLSFKSIRQYNKCPVGFYFSVILGMKGNIDSFNRVNENSMLYDEAPEYRKDNDEGYGSEKALLLGCFLHEYLEKHHFGEEMDKGLFDDVWEGLINKDPGSRMLNDDILTGVKQKAFNHLETIIKDKRLIKMVNRASDYAEVPFLFRVSGECEFRGVMDRLFKDQETGRWAILDWKRKIVTGLNI
ncbi:UvrD-helicase domain-containing protein [Thermodesulfobacteriota bacterium]